MLGDLYQNDTDAALDNLAALPPERAKPVSKWNGWSAPLRGITAGFAEVGGAMADVGKAVSDKLSAVSDENGSNAFDLLTIPARLGADVGRGPKEGQFTSEAGTSFRNVSRDYRPDPATASTAERLTFDLSRFVTKAVGYTVTGGGLAGATMLGGDEGLTVADDLAQQGVDIKTRTKAGAVAGVAAGAGVLLPVAAPASKLATAGLWAVGGPGAFMAQQAATRSILREANYKELAEAYDPLDPVGLAVSSLVPAGFAGYALHSAGLAARSKAAIKPIADDAQPATAATGAEQPKVAGLTPDETDAVMTHNLTLAQDVRDATAPADALKMVQPNRPLPDLSDAHILRLADQQRQVMVDLYTKAELVKPAFDERLHAIAELTGGRVKLAEVKGVERAVDKVVGDYSGDPSQIKDLVRGTVVVRTLQDVERVVGELREKFEVLETGFRNSLTDVTVSPNGYRDVKLNVRIDGHTAEVQVNLAEMVAAKSKAHPLYERQSALARKISDEERAPTQAERSEAVALQQQQREIYTAAWAEAASARNLSSDTTTPLRMAESQGNERASLLSQAVATSPDSTVTGIPSTSTNSVPAGKDSGSIGGSFMSMETILPEGGHFGNEAPPLHKDPLTRSVLGRVAELERIAPDMVVGKDATGNDVTVRQEMERIRRESFEGTDTELGARDAELLEVAANCALTLGTPV